MLQGLGSGWKPTHSLSPSMWEIWSRFDWNRGGIYDPCILTLSPKDLSVSQRAYAIGKGGDLCMYQLSWLTHRKQGIHRLVTPCLPLETVFWVINCQWSLSGHFCNCFHLISIYLHIFIFSPPNIVMRFYSSNRSILIFPVVRLLLSLLPLLFFLQL